jgi:hypothetical protein
VNIGFSKLPLIGLGLLKIASPVNMVFVVLALLMATLFRLIKAGICGPMVHPFVNPNTAIVNIFKTLFFIF